MTVKVFFRHLRYEFPDEQLIRYGSPYFDASSAGVDLLNLFREGVTKVSEHSATFDRRHILVANESFPEAALADPLADLEVWDDWRTGLRAFPYPGTYSKLGITQQEAKTSATSSVGVLGEIMAGIYAQAGVSPWVLVRVIRHWPDFIFGLQQERYAFVEAKAYTRSDLQSSTQEIPNKLLAECLATSIHQLNADPFVQVWGAFTCIEKITPLELKVTFLELDTNDGRRKVLTRRVLPDLVIDGIAERLISTSFNRLDETYIQRLTDDPRDIPRGVRERLEAALVAAAMQELETMLVDQGLKVVMLQSRQAIAERVQKIVRRIRLQDATKTTRLFSALGESQGERIARVRSIGAGELYAVKLTMSDYVEVARAWDGRWTNATEPWRTTGGIPLWRCGGAAFGIAGQDLDGERLR